MIKEIDYELLDKDLDAFFSDDGAIKVSNFRDIPKAAEMMKCLLGVVYALQGNEVIYKKALKEEEFRKALLENINNDQE